MRCSDKAAYQRVCACKHGIRPNTVGKRGFALGDVAGCTTPRGRPCLNPQRTQGRNAPVPQNRLSALRQSEILNHHADN